MTNCERTSVDVFWVIIRGFCLYCDHILPLGATIELSRLGELSLAEHLQGARVSKDNTLFHALQKNFANSINLTQCFTCFYYNTKFLPLESEFLDVSHWIPQQIKYAAHLLQISASVQKINVFKFEKRVKYANDVTDDVIHSTQYYNKLKPCNRDHWNLAGLYM